MLSDDDLMRIRSNLPDPMMMESNPADWFLAAARAVEAAAYEAAIRAIEATRIDPEDVIEEFDRETNRTICWCAEVVRSMLPKKEQPE